LNELTLPKEALAVNSSSALWILLCVPILVRPVAAETMSTQLTPANIRDQALSFTIKVERISDGTKEEKLNFRVTVEPKVPAVPLSPVHSAALQVLDGKAFVADGLLGGSEGGGRVSYSFRVAAKYAATSKFIFNESPGDFDNRYYWFYLKDFAEVK
jgi:hypothetical protein